MALAGESDPAVSTPASYTPKCLAERILTSKAALEGECKQVTILFADLKGSMELLADRDPEEARTLLDPVLERHFNMTGHPRPSRKHDLVREAPRAGGRITGGRASS
jgi:hypothetical protein